MRPAGVVVSMASVIERKPAPAADALHDVQHVFQRARQAIEFPDDDGVAAPMARPRRVPSICSNAA
jgi:hypothetical protein